MRIPEDLVDIVTGHVQMARVDVEQERLEYVCGYGRQLQVVGVGCLRHLGREVAGAGHQGGLVAGDGRPPSCHDQVHGQVRGPGDRWRWQHHRNITTERLSAQISSFILTAVISGQGSSKYCTDTII